MNIDKNYYHPSLIDYDILVIFKNIFDNYTNYLCYNN